MSAEQEPFKSEAYGTVSPPPGKEFCPECDAKGGPDCPVCHGTWVISKEDD